MTNIPTSCDTPLHTCDILAQAIEEQSFSDNVRAASFVSVDIRVLRWLINDARALNTLISETYAA